MELEQTKYTKYLGVVLDKGRIWNLPTEWGCAANKHIHKLQVVQNKLFRTILGVPNYGKNETIHRDLRLAVQTVIKTVTKSEDHANPLMREIVDYEIEDGVRKLRKSRQLLAEH